MRKVKTFIHFGKQFYTNAPFVSIIDEDFGVENLQWDE